MKLWRNKEIRRLSAVLMMVSIIICTASFIVGFTSGMITVVTCVVFTSIIFVFTNNRHKSIAELADYLERICNGEYDLQFRDNEEGELSILKNEIYKVSVTLLELAEMMKKERQSLASYP